MNIQAVLKEIKTADVENVFMLGESRVGMMTFQAIKNKYPIRAAVTIGAMTDLSAYIADHQWEEERLSGLWNIGLPCLGTKKLTCPFSSCTAPRTPK